MILPPWVKPAACALALTASFSAGWVVQGWRWAASDAKRLAAEVKAKDKQLARQNDIATQYEADRERVRVEYITREGQVRTIYETVEVPAECAAPDSVRSVLESAVASANSSASKSGG